MKTKTQKPRRLKEKDKVYNVLAVEGKGYFGDFFCITYEIFRDKGASPINYPESFILYERKSGLFPPARAFNYVAKAIAQDSGLIGRLKKPTGITVKSEFNSSSKRRLTSFELSEISRRVIKILRGKQ